MSNNKVIYFTSLLVALILIFTLNEKPSLTGFATFATNSEARAVIDTFSQDNSLKLLGQGSQLCAVVEIDNETTYYFNVAKSEKLAIIQLLRKNTAQTQGRTI